MEIILWGLIMLAATIIIALAAMCFVRAEDGHMSTSAEIRADIRADLGVLARDPMGAGDATAEAMAEVEGRRP